MTMGIQKKIWWSALILSGGGSIALIFICLSGLNPPVVWWIWPPATVSSAVALSFCYKAEPSTVRGYWHLRIEDLLCAAFYAAFLLAVTQHTLENLFMKVGMPFTLLNVVALLLGLLAAQRRGITARTGKFAFAFGYGTRLVGLLGLGALAVVILMDWLSFNTPFFWLRQILFGVLEFAPLEGRWLLVLHRMALVCLPAGLMMTFVAQAWIRRTAVRPVDVAAN
jgi:hypothetical protein